MKPPSNQALRKKGNVIDQRQQQINPAGKHRESPSNATKGSLKQPGQMPRDAQGKADRDT